MAEEQPGGNGKAVASQIIKKLIIDNIAKNV
jgi:hypothetical protein